MKLLLINPRFPESFWSFKWVSDALMPRVRTTNPPLGLATLAALCPPHWEVEIVDENVESVPLNPDADIIGVCGMGVQFRRQKELLTFYGNQGYFVVAGGSYASLCPELYETLADAVVAGEAEYIWPQFCADFERGARRRLYQETGAVALTDSPVPRFDLLDLSRYQAVSLQFSRGCPFRCEFCDIIVMFGRKPRTKSLQQVERELDRLRHLGVRSAFFVDDNLIGNKPLAKELLRFLRDYQERHRYPMTFGTEASLNMAQDAELLHLFRQANFKWVFIGIESPDEASLKETMKYQNTREDLLTSIRKIYAHGIDILAGFIVGFDNDTVATFDKQFEFIMNSGIQAAMVGLLTAAPKTPLYERLEKAGRLIAGANSSDNTKLETNVMPLQMTYAELVSGYRRLYFRLLSDRNIATRIRNKLRFLRRPIFEHGLAPREAVPLLARFVWRGLLRGGVTRIARFLWSLPYTAPRAIPLAIKDWIVGLAMRDYVDRHFVTEFEQANQLAHRYLQEIERAFRRYVTLGALELSLHRIKDRASEVQISLKRGLDRRFFADLSKDLKRLLKHTRTSVTLHIEELHEAQSKHLQRLLKDIAAYGHRVNIQVSAHLRDLVEIDSSVFNFVFET